MVTTSCDLYAPRCVTKVPQVRLHGSRGGVFIGHRPPRDPGDILLIIQQNVQQYIVFAQRMLIWHWNLLIITFIHVSSSASCKFWSRSSPPVISLPFMFSSPSAGAPGFLSLTLLTGTPEGKPVMGSTGKAGWVAPTIGSPTAPAVAGTVSFPSALWFSNFRFVLPDSFAVVLLPMSMTGGTSRYEGSTATAARPNGIK